MKSLSRRTAPAIFALLCSCAGITSAQEPSSAVMVAPRLDVSLPLTLLDGSVFLGPAHLLLADGGSMSIVAITDVEFDFLEDVRGLPAYVLGFADLESLGALTPEQVEVVKSAKAIVLGQVGDGAEVTRTVSAGRIVYAALGSESSVAYIVTADNPNGVIYLHSKGVDAAVLQRILMKGGKR